jgi:hypothetical protein
VYERADDATFLNAWGVDVHDAYCVQSRTDKYIVDEATQSPFLMECVDLDNLLIQPHDEWGALIQYYANMP